MAASDPATRGDLDRAVAELRIEWRGEMIAQTRWLAGLFVVQFVSTIVGVSGVVFAMLKAVLPS